MHSFQPGSRFVGRGRGADCLALVRQGDQFQKVIQFQLPSTEHKDGDLWKGHELVTQNESVVLLHFSPRGGGGVCTLCLCAVRVVSKGAVLLLHPPPPCNPLACSHLPVMDEAHVLGGIHGNDGVSVQRFSSPWWLPAVENPSHSEQPPSFPFFISLHLLVLQERGPIVLVSAGPWTAKAAQICQC